jgi:hypothetical protein
MSDMLFYIDHESDDVAADVYNDAAEWYQSLGREKGTRFQDALEELRIGQTIVMGDHELTMVDRADDGAVILEPELH